MTLYTDARRKFQTLAALGAFLPICMGAPSPLALPGTQLSLQARRSANAMARHFLPPSKPVRFMDILAATKLDHKDIRSPEQSG